MTTRRITDQWLQYIRGQVALSTANTFTQVTIPLPVVVSEGLVIQAHLIEFELPAVTIADISATDDNLVHRCQITRTSQTGPIGLLNPDLIYGITEEFEAPAARTAEGKPVVYHIRQGELNKVFADPILLPFSQIFFGGTTAGASQADSFNFRIGYKTIKLRTNQLAELIQAVS